MIAGLPADGSQEAGTRQSDGQRAGNEVFEDPGLGVQISTWVGSKGEMCLAALSGRHAVAAALGVKFGCPPPIAIRCSPPGALLETLTETA